MTQGRWSQIESRFRTHLLDRFDQASKPASSDDKPEYALAQPSRLDDFKLMDADDLEESLAANTLANAIASLCVDDLVTLNPRLGTLLNDPEFKRSQNPLSPEIIGESLMDTLQELDGSTRSKLDPGADVRQSISRSGCKSVYQGNQPASVHQRRVLPALPVHHQHNRHGDKVTPEDTGGRDESATAGGKSPAPGQVTFESSAAAGLVRHVAAADEPGAHRQHGRRLCQRTRFPRQRQSAVSAATAPGSPVWRHSVAAGVSGGNGGQFPELPANRQAGRLGCSATWVRPANRQRHISEPVDGDSAWRGVRRPRPCPGRRRRSTPATAGSTSCTPCARARSARDLSQIDSMTLDIVALLFDFILDDRRIPDAMKAVIGRLQIPIAESGAWSTRACSPTRRTRHARCSTPWPRPPWAGMPRRVTTAPCTRRSARWWFAS
jgi:hypothetical protein